MRKPIVAPSLLAADFRFLDRELKALEKANIKLLHFDVMDGHFVPNLSFGLPLLAALSPHYDFHFDVHLMISNPEEYVVRYIESGADIVTFHLEAMQGDKACFELIDLIHAHGAKAGMSIKPNTKVERIIPYLSKLDLVLVMSVEPGFGGQRFLPDALNKIKYLKDFRTMKHFTYVIEVDGGINFETAKLVREAGADILVAGSYVFEGDNIEQRIDSLRDE